MMVLYQQLLTRNDCYTAGKTIVPKGVMVHSTGANNPNVSRYVPGDEVLGVNRYGNHWDQPGISKCVHAFIGKIADGSVAAVQTLPWDRRGWHAGTGTSGRSANDTHISFEICEDGLEDPEYFSQVYQAAVELTAMLCRQYGLDPLADGVVICHQEGYQRGIASNHADVLHWFPKFGRSMDDFRGDVAAALNPPEDATTLVSLYDGVYDLQPETVTISLVDAPKTSLTGNYCNAGYFGNYEEGSDPFTLPSGHLVADMETESKWATHYLEERGEIKNGKAIFDSSQWEYMNPLYGKAVTTLLLQDGKASIQEVQKLPVCDYAVAGIPVLRDGKKVDLGTVLAQGWDKSSLRATSHIFVGLKEGKLHLMGLETKTVDLLTEAGDLFLRRGFTDVIKLDGGGSYIIQSNVIQSQTAEDRRICSIIRFGPCKMEEVEPVDEGYEKFKSYMDRYRKELGAQAADPWAVPYIQKAIKSGLMAEVDGSIERPRDFVTRQELATSLAATIKA